MARVLLLLLGIIAVEPKRHGKVFLSSCSKNLGLNIT